MTAVKRTIIILSLCAIWFGGMLIGFSVGTAMADEKYTGFSGTGYQVEINEDTGEVTIRTMVDAVQEMDGYLIVKGVRYENNVVKGGTE